MGDKLIIDAAVTSAADIDEIIEELCHWIDRETSIQIAERLVMNTMEEPPIVECTKRWANKLLNAATRS